MKLFFKQLFCKHVFIEMWQQWPGEIWAGGKSYQLAEAAFFLCPKCKKVKVQ